MNLPYQSPAVDRANGAQAAMQNCVDPALFGLSWDDVRGGISSVANFLAPHAKTAAQDFATAVINDL